MNRYFSNGLGRFTSPDPFGADASLKSPQSWNRYSYVDGDPINFTDTAGLEACHADFCVQVVGTDTPVELPQTPDPSPRPNPLPLPPPTPTVWTETLSVLNDSVGSLAAGITVKCQDFLAETLGISWPDLQKALQQITFQNGTTAGNAGVYGAFNLPGNGGIYAYTPPSQERDQSKFIYWRPGELGSGRSTSNWLSGAILHEALHFFREYEGQEGDTRIIDLFGIRSRMTTQTDSDAGDG